MESKKGIRFNSGRRIFQVAADDYLPERVGELTHGGITRSLRFMAQNYLRPIQLNDVVVVSGMSRRGFIKAFNKHLGVPPISLLRQMRIKSAKRLLIEQDLPLRIITQRTGFRRENTFCIAFQRETGLAPKQFQRRAWLSAYRSTRFQQNSQSQQIIK